MTEFVLIGAPSNLCQRVLDEKERVAFGFHMPTGVIFELCEPTDSEQRAAQLIAATKPVFDEVAREMDALARDYATTKDEAVKEKILELGRRLEARRRMD